MNQKVKDNKNNNNNKNNLSNSLVFGRWPQTKIEPEPFFFQISDPLRFQPSFGRGAATFRRRAILQHHQHLPVGVVCRRHHAAPDPELLQLLHQHHVLAFLHSPLRPALPHLQREQLPGRLPEVRLLRRAQLQRDDHLRGDLPLRHRRHPTATGQFLWPLTHLSKIDLSKNKLVRFGLQTPILTNKLFGATFFR